MISHRHEVASKQAAVETPVTIYVNTEPVATLLATPNAQAELAVRYLIGEGILRSYGSPAGSAP